MQEEQLYTIAEVSDMLSVTESALRYYESIGLMEPVWKNAGGHRRYAEKDLRRIRFIQQLRAAGVPVREIRRYVDLVYDGEQTIPERKQLLIDQLDRLKQQMRQMEGTIGILEDMIDHYEETLIKREMERRKADKNAYRREK